MLRRLTMFVGLGLLGLVGFAIYWNANPSPANLEMPPRLTAFVETASVDDVDYALLVPGFQSQVYRSFCGPASIATILRAYGATHVDQTDLFPSLSSKANAFFTGLTLAELAELAEHTGLQTEIIYADTLTVDTFRERLKRNLVTEGDYLLINYDRRVLNESGAGHISPIAAYDAEIDSFLVLDQAAYKYPFTWVPAELLFEAMHTLDGDRYRGLVVVRGYSPPAS